MSFKFRAVRWRNRNTPLQIKQTTLPVKISPDGTPAVGSDWILVKVRAASLNPVDLLMKNAAIPWLFFGEKGFGLDYSGDVVAIGASAAAKVSLQVGDRVCGLKMDMYGEGTLSEYILVNPYKKTGASIRKIPGKLSYEQAAAYPLVGGTAESMFEHCQPNKFRKVLVLGAGTSVGRYAVQLASKVYASEHVVVTCLGKTEALARELGATEVIDYTKNKNVLNAVLDSVAATGQFDAILDCVGNSDLFGHMSTILRGRSDHGLYITIAGDGKLDYKASPVGNFLLNVAVAWRTVRSTVGLLLYYYTFILVNGRDPWPDRMVEFFESRDIRIFIDSTYEFDRFGDAVARLQSNRATGKVVVTI